MDEGFAVGAECFRDFGQAQRAVCTAAFQPLSDGGIASCDAAEDWGGGQVGLHMKFWRPSTGATYETTHVQLARCEPQDVVTYAPHIAAWFAALVLVLCTRSLWAWVLKREA